MLRVSLTGHLLEVSDAPKPERKSTRPSWTTPQATPDAAAVAFKQKELRAVMPGPGPKATAQQANKHAEAILIVGLETKDDVPLRYAALREAFELAYPLGDPEIAGRALRAIQEDYMAEPVALKTAALNRAIASASDPESFRKFSQAIDEFVNEAVADDDLDRAEKAGPASPSPELQKAGRRGSDRSWRDQTADPHPDAGAGPQELVAAQEHAQEVPRRCEGERGGRQVSRGS